MLDQKNQNAESGGAHIFELKLPKFLMMSVSLKYVALGYYYVISNAMHLFIISLLVSVFTYHRPTLSIEGILHNFTFVQITLRSFLTVFLATFYFKSHPRGVYLVDFACYKPHHELMCPNDLFMERSKQAGYFSEENLMLQRKILERSGLGQKTYFPPAVLSVPPNPCMAEARKEAEEVMFGAIDELLEKTGVRAKDVGILVVNCSLFNPTPPSLSAMIVNHYKLTQNIITQNVYPYCYALVVTIENITLNWYTDSNNSMLVSNCLFRMGGAAILLSNRSV